MADESPFQPAEEPPSSLFGSKKKPTGPKDSTPRQATRGRPNKHAQRKEKLLTLLSTIGSGVMFFEQFDGMCILQHAEDVAEATATLADENAHVAKAIDNLATGGAYGALLIALCAMVLPILAHHNIIPEFVAKALVPQEPNQAA